MSNNEVSKVYKRAAALSMEDKAELVGMLKESIENPRVVISPAERYQVLLGFSEAVWGKKLTASKSGDDVRIRMFVSNKMREEGFSYSDIGRAMGRSYCAIISHVKRMGDMFDEPIFYALELRKYAQFVDMVKENDRQHEEGE